MGSDIFADAPELAEPEVLEQGAMTVPQGTSVIQTRGSYSTAMKVANPRKLAIVQNRLKEEAQLMGERAYYGWGAGKDRIEGPSQALAHAAARCWGNCAVEPGPIQDAGDSWVFTAYFVDLETGFTLGRQFRQSKKWTVYGKHDAERKDDIRFQIGASKASRNVILKALPAGLVDQAMDKAKQGVREAIERYISKNGIAKAVEVALKELAKLGVTEDDVCRRFSIAKTTALTVEHLVIVKGDIAAIQDGQGRPEDLYPDEQQPEGASASEIVQGAGKAEPQDITGTPAEAKGEPAQAQAAREPGSDDDLGEEKTPGEAQGGNGSSQSAGNQESGSEPKKKGGGLPFSR